METTELQQWGAMFSTLSVPRGYIWDSLEFSYLWYIRQPVRTLAKDIVNIRYQETISEEIEDFRCAKFRVIFRVRKPVRLL
jgi:hypothetical protein